MGSPGMRPSGTLARYAWLLAFLLIVAVAVPVVWRVTATRDDAGPALTAVAPPAARVWRETRPTLDPVRFVGKAALAHQVAREIPDTLDQLYCYCECDKHSGHKSLLSCYTDGHAAT
jgi:hypothetical protein